MLFTVHIRQVFNRKSLSEKEVEGGGKEELNTGQHVMSMDQCVWSHVTSAGQEQIV